jgi:hypothetical protein
MAIWYNIWPFGVVCGHLLYFSNFECLDKEKSGNLVGVYKENWCLASFKKTAPLALRWTNL